MEKISRTGFVLLLTAAAACAADAPLKSAPRRGNDSPGLSIVPKAFQKNPKIDCNIVTETTGAGQKLPVPTAQNPVYYFLQAGYYQNLGEAAPANAKPPPVALLQRLIKESLAAANYLEADPPAHQPTMVVVFNYGDHSATDGQAESTQAANDAQDAYQEAMRDRDNLIATLQASSKGELDENELPPPPPAPEIGGKSVNSTEELLPYVLADRRKARQLIDRAALIGGVAFAEELSKVLKEEVKIRQTNNEAARGSSRMGAETQRQALINAAVGMKDDLATQLTPTPEMNLASPFHRYYQRDAKTTYLLDEAFGSCYFVIASAFDGAALAKGEKRLLWRTKMTVNSSGVAIADTLPTLISTATPYFGRETHGTVVVGKRVLRNAAVEVGPTKVLEQAPVAETEKAKEPIPK
jgi:hypothetical protein